MTKRGVLWLSLCTGAALVAALLLRPAAPPPLIEMRLPGDALAQIMAGIYAADHLSDVGSGAVRGLIVPHHLTAAETIAVGIRTLSQQSPRGLVILSPDHFDRCPTLLCTTPGIFTTLLGPVAVEATAEGELSASPLVMESPELFQSEHGIGAVLPFVAHYVPGVPIVPVVLSQDGTWPAARLELARLFDALRERGFLLVISSDFSHYLSLAEADSEDEKTITTLLSGDLDAIAKLEDPSQTDCPGCLWTLVDQAKREDFFHPLVLLHTNSARILHDENVKETTSHVAVGFYGE